MILQNWIVIGEHKNLLEMNSNISPTLNHFVLKFEICTRLNEYFITAKKQFFKTTTTLQKVEISIIQIHGRVTTRSSFLIKIE